MNTFRLEKPWLVFLSPHFTLHWFTLLSSEKLLGTGFTANNYEYLNITNSKVSRAAVSALQSLITAGACFLTQANQLALKVFSARCAGLYDPAVTFCTEMFSS